MNTLSPIGTTAAPAIADPATSEKPAASSDFDTFLKLLTAQIRNQDPLEPTDATAYTSQLATFSNVEQSVKTNTLLSQMIARLDSQQVTGAANYIGMDVRHSGPVGHVGDQTTLYTATNAVADRAELVVEDLRGREIGRYPIDPKAESLGWPGSGQGASVPSGQYALHVESWAGDRALDPTPVAHYAQVEEVVLGSAGAELILRGGVRLPIELLESIRAPEPRAAS